MKNPVTIKDNRKPYIYFGVSVITLFIFLYSGFSASLNNYLLTQINNEAIALAKSKSMTIQTLDTSAKTVHDILVNQLLNVANLLVTTSSPDNVARNEVLGGNHLVDEINWLSADGEILYSSKDYEGRQFDKDHFFWSVVGGDKEYYLEDIRQGIYTGEYFLLLYVIAPDGSVVQVAILVDQLMDLLGQFSAEELMTETLENDRVMCAAVYIDTDTKALSFVSSNDLSELNEEQQTLILSGENQNRVSTINGKSALEVYISIENEKGAHIGSFFLAYSLEETEKFVFIASIIIVGFLSLIAVAFIALTLVLYRRDKQLTSAQFMDAETNILNVSFILENYNKLVEVRSTSDTTFAVLLISNYKRVQLLNTHDEMTKRIKHFVEIMEKHSEQNEIYRYQDDIFFMVSHNRTNEQIYNSINAVTKEAILDFEIKSTLINNAAGFDSVDTLFKACKITTHQLRESSENSIVVYTEDIQNELLKRQTIESDLRLLSVKGFAEELFVVFQPQIDVVSGEIVGFESLTRWIHPEFGFISPPLIFEIAENSDYYNSLTRWILTQALDFIKQLNINGYTKPVVSINTPNEYVLHPDCIENVRSILNHYGVSPNQLGFEITETTADGAIEQLQTRVSELNNLGITTYIDDYGRGHSSMLRLRDLDVNVLKIDKTFVDDIHKDERFLRSIISIAKELNLDIVAEGAENKEQVEWLRANNCNIVQGYYFSKPLKYEEAIDFMHNFTKPDSEL